MNKLIIIAALVATCLAMPSDINNPGEDFGFAIYDIPLAEIDASSISEKRDTSESGSLSAAADTIDENDLMRIQAVNALAELSRKRRSANATVTPKKLGLKDLLGRTSG